MCGKLKTLVTSFLCQHANVKVTVSTIKRKISVENTGKKYFRGNLHEPNEFTLGTQ